MKERFESSRTFKIHKISQASFFPVCLVWKEDEEEDGRTDTNCERICSIIDCSLKRSESNTLLFMENSQHYSEFSTSPRAEKRQIPSPGHRCIFSRDCLLGSIFFFVFFSDWENGKKVRRSNESSRPETPASVSVKSRPIPSSDAISHVPVGRLGIWLGTGRGILLNDHIPECPRRFKTFVI